MRLWSINPEYLDGKGLCALWREALLAKNVLEGRTKGYKHHPQLHRFLKYKDPLIAINSYLYFVYLEGCKRGYAFSESKIALETPVTAIIPVTTSQILYEFDHLCNKLKHRNVSKYEALCLHPSSLENIKPHPIFYVVSGAIEEWERT